MHERQRDAALGATKQRRHIANRVVSDQRDDVARASPKPRQILRGSARRQRQLAVVDGDSVDLERRRFYQLDDQEAPGPFAGRRVRVTGRMQGDTIYVTRIEPAEAAKR